MNTNTATAQSYPDQNSPQDLDESLVNKYASIKGRIDGLKTEQKRLTAELKSVEVEIINYASEKGLPYISAGNIHAYLQEVTIKKFPLVDKIGRMELEEIIKKAGKWENVSTLSLSKLKSFVWDYRDTHQELVKELSNFQKKTMKTTVKLVRMINVYDKGV